MTKKIALVGVLLFTLQSCVSSRVFNDLEERYAQLKMEHEALSQKKDSLNMAALAWEKRSDSLAQKLEQTQSSLSKVEKAHRQLQKEFSLLQKSSDSSIQKALVENSSLLEQIEEKQQQLALRSQRVSELESLMMAQEKALNSLKQRLSDALLNFEGKGLTVEQRNGKVYVSMQNKLLFRSGQWKVGKEGKQALQQLATVLAENPDIAVLIEGHTDNVPYKGKGAVEGNWDLSTKRATAVVQILLENGLVLPQNLTAAGRSEFLPVGPNRTSEGRTANRRIEVILSPNLNEISVLLNTL
ncbi:MAG: OmpA family protein [Flavobacteriaceae bacterium]|nr:OmpA family protein [Flavobacteriaceae bacterium]